MEFISPAIFGWIFGTLIIGFGLGAILTQVFHIAKRSKVAPYQLVLSITFLILILGNFVAAIILKELKFEKAAIACFIALAASLALIVVAWLIDQKVIKKQKIKNYPPFKTEAKIIRAKFNSSVSTASTGMHTTYRANYLVMFEYVYNGQTKKCECERPLTLQEIQYLLTMQTPIEIEVHKDVCILLTEIKNDSLTSKIDPEILKQIKIVEVTSGLNIKLMQKIGLVIAFAMFVVLAVEFGMQLFVAKKYDSLHFIYFAAMILLCIASCGYFIKLLIDDKTQRKGTPDFATSFKLIGGFRATSHEPIYSIEFTYLTSDGIEKKETLRLAQVQYEQISQVEKLPILVNKNKAVIDYSRLV